MNQKTSPATTALFDAITDNDLMAAKKSIDDGADLSSKTEGGLSVAGFAERMGAPEIAFMIAATLKQRKIAIAQAQVGIALAQARFRAR